MTPYSSMVEKFQLSYKQQNFSLTLAFSHHYTYSDQIWHDGGEPPWRAFRHLEKCTWVCVQANSFPHYFLCKKSVGILRTMGLLLGFGGGGVNYLLMLLGYGGKPKNILWIARVIINFCFSYVCITAGKCPVDLLALRNYNCSKSDSLYFIVNSIDYVHLYILLF